MKCLRYFCIVLVIVFITATQAGKIGKLEELYKWKQISYDYGQPEIGADNIVFPYATRSTLPSDYVAYNNVPFGATHYKDKLFITLPRRRPGVPATLNYISLNAPKGSSPSLRGFPNYELNALHPRLQPDANRIVSVYRTHVDVCNRLWFVDTGLLEYPNNSSQVQRPSIWVWDLEQNRLVNRFDIPESIVARGNGLASITADVDANDCGNAFAYLPDLAVYRLHVYSLKQNRIWSFTHNFFHFDPLQGDLDIAGVQFQWNDGIFSIALGKKNPDGFKTAYFHAMASMSTFAVSTRVLKNETASTRSNHGRDFRHLGIRGPNSQSTMHSFDESTGVIFYAQIHKNGVACWNTEKPASPENLILIDQDDDAMIYPCDLNIDSENTIWVLTNTLPRWIYSNLNPNEYNFRVWRQSTAEAIKGTACDVTNRYNSFDNQRPSSYGYGYL